MKDVRSDEDIRKAISSVCLAYDNMCHMDSLKIANGTLPLPEPFNESWNLIGKVIDRLHLRNHVDPKCKQMYNADDKIPKGFDTMACEQTFIWASRFKVMCAMPHIHQFFCTIVKYRNAYTEKCHELRKPQFFQKLVKMQSKSSKEDYKTLNDSVIIL